MGIPLIRSLIVKHIWTDKTPDRPTPDKIQRASERRAITLPARLTWKDQQGTARFAAVVTRDVSDLGVYVECLSQVSIPLYRLVQFQLESQARHADGLPAGLRNGRVLAAVYRVSPPKPSARQGLALRLMVEPCRRAADIVEDARATA
jgi:hypothetical protein